MMRVVHFSKLPHNALVSSLVNKQRVCTFPGVSRENLLLAGIIELLQKISQDGKNVKLHYFSVTQQIVSSR